MIGNDIKEVNDLNTQLVQAKGNPDLIGVLSGQRKSTVIDACSKAIQVNPAIPLQGEQATFVAQNCSAGTIAPGSLYN
jgi:hypothetical protein